MAVWDCSPHEEDGSRDKGDGADFGTDDSRKASNIEEAVAEEMHDDQGPANEPQVRSRLVVGLEAAIALEYRGEGADQRCDCQDIGDLEPVNHRVPLYSLETPVT